MNTQVKALRKALEDAVYQVQNGEEDVADFLEQSPRQIHVLYAHSLVELTNSSLDSTTLKSASAFDYLVRRPLQPAHTINQEKFNATAVSDDLMKVLNIANSFHLIMNSMNAVSKASAAGTSPPASGLQVLESLLKGHFSTRLTSGEQIPVTGFMRLQILPCATPLSEGTTEVLGFDQLCVIIDNLVTSLKSLTCIVADGESGMG